MNFKKTLKSYLVKQIKKKDNQHLFIIALVPKSVNFLNLKMQLQSCGVIALHKTKKFTLPTATQTGGSSFILYIKTVHNIVSIRDLLEKNKIFVTTVYFDKYFFQSKSLQIFEPHTQGTSNLLKSLVKPTSNFFYSLLHPLVVFVQLLTHHAHHKFTKHA